MEPDRLVRGGRGPRAARGATCGELADQSTCVEHRPTRAVGAAAFWVVAGVFVVGMAGGALPTPLYPLYQARFGLSNITVTIVFAAYAAGVLSALLVLGRLSDSAGRKPALLLVAGFAAVSTLIFLFAQGLPWLFVGRFVSGLAIGTLTGTATAALAELEPHGDKRKASLIAAMITPGGLALGTLVAGALAQYGPAPLRLVYGVYLGALVALVAGVAALPETVPAATGRLAFHVQRLHVPADIRRPFAAAAFGVFSGFVVMGLLSGLAPSFLGESLHEHNVFVAGLLVSVMFGAAASAPLVVGRRVIGTAALLGVACVIAGLTLVLIALATRSLASFFAGALVVGLGIGSLFAGTLALINRYAPADRRAEVVSAFFVAGYTGLTLPVVGVGIASEHIGVLTAAEWLAGMVVVLALAALLGIRRAAARAAQAPPEQRGDERGARAA